MDHHCQSTPQPHQFNQSGPTQAKVMLHDRNVLLTTICHIEATNTTTSKHEAAQEAGRAEDFA